MTMDPNRWINTLPPTSETIDVENNVLDHNRWIDTIAKKNTKRPTKKYPIIAFLFIVGLIFVSLIKNETRNLQKEINKLQASINVLKLDLHQATLDHEVITSPENISRLANEYLELNLSSYKKSQISQLNNNGEEILTKLEKKQKGESFKEKTKKISQDVKIEVAKKIEEKRNELKKLKEIYSEPEKLPSEIKIQVAKKIESKKMELKNLVTSPKDVINFKKIHQWAGIQIVKVFLGIPIIPGR